MKSPFAELQNPDKSLEFALRDSAPVAEFPSGLHDSIMRAVKNARCKEGSAISGFDVMRRFVQVRWLPITGLNALVIVGIWLIVQNRTEHVVSPLPEISTAFTASQKVVDALPSVTVGALSDELDKVNQDLNRTADFLLATLP